MALAVTADTAAWPHETEGVVFASLEEQKAIWWCRDGGLAQAASKIVRMALDRGGRAACATADGVIYALAPHLRGAAREWRCVAQTKTNVSPVETWLAFDCARDGRVLVATARGLHVFAPALANEEAVEDHGLSLKAAALSNSGACLAASSENRLVAWRRDESWKPVALHHDCNRGYTDLKWAVEGRERLLCVSEDGAVRVLALERKGRDGPLALEPFCQMREPGPSLVSATWAPSADDGTARVCVTRETDDGLDVELRRVHGAPSDDAFAARVRPGDQCEDAAFTLASPSSGIKTVVALDSESVVIVGNVEADSVYHDGAPRPLRDLLETPSSTVIAHPFRNELAVLEGKRCRTSTWDASSQGGWARNDDPLRLQSEDEAATRYSGAFPFFTKSVELSGNALGACWRGDDLIIALETGEIVSDDKTLATSAPVNKVHALLARGDVVARVSNDSISAWRAGKLVDEVSIAATCAATHAWLLPASAAAFLVGDAEGIRIAELRADRWVLETAVACAAPSLLCTAAAGARVASYTTEITLYRRGDATDAFLLTKLSTIQASDPVVAMRFPDDASSRTRCAHASVHAPWAGPPSRLATSHGNGVVRVYVQKGDAWALWRRLEAFCGVAGRAFAGVADLVEAERPPRRRALVRACAVCAGVDEGDGSDDDEDDQLAAIVADAAQGTSMVEIASKARGDGDQPLFGLAVVHLLLAADEREVDVSRIQQGGARDAGPVALRVLRRDRLSWWAPTRTLKKTVEEAAAACARLASKGGRDVPGSAASSALLYVACGRVATLKTLARSDSSRGGLCGEWGRKLGKLLQFDFGTERGQIAGRKNAYALLAKHEPALACAAFLLAGDVDDACSVALSKLQDPELSLMIARLADGHDGLVCGPLARKALRGILRAYDCSPETAALASLWLGRPQRAARHLASIVDAARSPSTDAAPLDAFEAAFDTIHGPGLVRRLVGTAGARRVALDGARACLNRGAPTAALAALAALDAEVAPFSSPVRRFAAAGAAPSQPPPASSIFDDFAAAPQRPAPAAPAASSIFDDFDAAPPRKAPPPPQAESSIFDGFDAAPPKPPPPPQAESSIFDGFDAAPQRQAAPPPPPQSSIFDEFDAAPQQRKAPPSMLDGFDAAPRQRKAPPSMLDGFDAAPQRRAPPSDTAPAREEAPTEAASSGDDDTPEAPPPPRERAREVALEAAAARLAARARACARQVGGDDVKARLAALKTEAKELQATHGLASAELNKAALATLASEPGARPATAYTIIHAATSNDPTAAARRVLTKAATDALRFASLPNDAAPSSQARAEANRTTDDLRACVTLSESLENFASQKLAQRAAAGARCASTKAPPERRRRVYRALLEHPPQQSSDEVNGAAGAALELAKRFDDSRGWDRLRALDRRGAEDALRDKAPGSFLLRPQQGSSGDAAVAISFVVEGNQVQHAIIRVSENEGALEYRSGRLGPASSLWLVLEEISERLGGAGLDLTEAATTWPSEALDAHLPPDVGGDLDDLGGHWSSSSSIPGIYWSAGERRKRIVDVLACDELRKQLRDLGALSPPLERRASALRKEILRQLTPPLQDLHHGISDGRRHRSPAPLRRGSPVASPPTSPPRQKPIAAEDGHVLAQLLHPRSGVSLRAPRTAVGFLTPSVNAVVSACFAPDEAAQWLAQHAHATDEEDAARKLDAWKGLRILVDAPSNEPQLRYVDAWECEPVGDDEDELCIEGTVAIGRNYYQRPQPTKGDLSRLLDVDEWVSSVIRNAHVDVDDDDLTTPWPPQPTSIDVDSSYKRHVRGFLLRNAWFRRHGLKRRFSASVRVDLEALETMAGALSPGSADEAAKAAARAPPVDDAFAVLRLRHARPKGSQAPPPLSEKLRTRDSCIAKRRGKVHVGGGATWGAAAAFRFALPDEALPPQNSVRLPTRGPPTVAYVCVYRREKHALAALGVPAQETYLGDVEVPLDNLTEDQPLTQWLPLNGGKGQHWFLRVRVTLAFVLCELADAPASVSPMPTPDERPKLVSSFSDFGD